MSNLCNIIYLTHHTDHYLHSLAKSKSVSSAAPTKSKKDSLSEADMEAAIFQQLELKLAGKEDANLETHLGRSISI